MNLTRRRFLKWSASGLGAGMAGLSYSTLIEPQRIAIEHVTAPVPRLPAALEGLKIAALSDFHLHPFTTLAHLKAAVELTNPLKPDLAVLLGDFVDSTVDAIDELAPELGRLNARFGVAAVLGNHDHWKGPAHVRRALTAQGIMMLNNSGFPVSGGRGQLFIAGLDSAWAGHPNLRRALDRRRSGDPTVLLVHEPDYADQVKPEYGVAVQLSGHSHGGQVRIPLIGALSLPSWGRKYPCGSYQLGPMLLHTNRGLGCVRLPVRFNCTPEITLLTLVGA